MYRSLHICNTQVERGHVTHLGPRSPWEWLMADPAIAALAASNIRIPTCARPAIRMTS